MKESGRGRGSRKLQKGEREAERLREREKVPLRRPQRERDPKV